MFNEDEYVNFSLVHRKPLFEADDDPNEETGGNDVPAADAEAGEDTGGEDPNTDDNANEGSNEEPSEDENNGDEDFNINGDDAEGEEDEEGGTDEEGEGEDTEGEDVGSEPEPGLGDNTDYTNPNIEHEKEIYDDLSPEEQQMKDKALRKQYADMYTNIENIINKLDSISTEIEDITAQSKKLIVILYEFKQIIHDYFNNLYNSKSYIENLQNFEKYKLFLFGIKNIIKSIDKMSEEMIENK